MRRKGSVGGKRMAANEEEAVKYVWEGAIPLQIHLHKSEVASHPPPPPALVTHSLFQYLQFWNSLVGSRSNSSF